MRRGVNLINLYIKWYWRRFVENTWPKISLELRILIALMDKFYQMQLQRQQVFSQFFNVRRRGALRLVRWFIYSMQKPTTLLRDTTRGFLATFLTITRLAGSPRTVLVVRVLLIVFQIILFIGVVLMLLL